MMRNSVLAKLGSTALSSPLSSRRGAAVLLLGAVSLWGSAAHADPLPTGGTVVQGRAGITTAPGAVTIDQSSARAVINWDGFSVGAGQSVVFNQPDAQSATLNRVTGATSSEIAGRIGSNGAVYLVNPNGIAITSTGTVETAGGFVASTLDIADGDFMSGNARFTGRGASAKISNAGRIAAGTGAYVALLGGSVSNSGYVSVPLGKVGLGSGEAIALDINGGNFMQVGVPTSALTGNAALIDHSGRIVADGGRVQLKAATLKDAVRNIINLSGSISADSATGSGGTIELLAGDGGLTATGTLSARATGASGDGGRIETSGSRLALDGLSVSTVAANGATGEWLLDPVDFTVRASGGDMTGAQLTGALAGNNVTIRSSGGSQGSAGNVNINDGVTWAANTLTLDAYNNINVNAVMAATGTAKFVGVTGDTAQAGTSSNAGAALLMALDPQAGFIGRLDLAPTASFRLNGADYTIVTTLGAQGSTTGTDLQGMQGNLAGNYVLGADIDASSTAGWNGGAGFAPVGESSLPFAGRLNGSGHTVDGLTTNLRSGNLGGLIGATSGNGSASVGNIGLRNVAISVTNNYTTVTVGALVAVNYAKVYQSFATGELYGTTEWGNYNYVGGIVGQNFGSVSTSFADATARASGGFQSAGGLIGSNRGALSKSSASGAVSVNINGGNAGGLVGYNDGTISQTSADAKVHLVYSSYGGGLVGSNAYGGTILDSYSVGIVDLQNSAITGGVDMGGLVGLNAGQIKNSFSATKLETRGAGADLGGLVSTNNGTVEASYWDIDASGTTSSGCCRPSSGVGLTTAQMQDFATYASTYAGWDFNSVWAPPSQAGQARQTQGFYPSLYALSPVEFANPTSSRTYGSSSQAGLVAGGPGTYAFGILGDWQNGNLFTSSATLTSNVGQYAASSNLSGNSITSANGATYRLITAPSGTLAITPASLVLSGTRNYNGLTSVDGSTLTATGALGQTFAVLGSGNSSNLASANASATARALLTLTGLSLGTSNNGGLASNYLPLTVSGSSYTITPAPVVVTALGGSSTYGSFASNPGLSATGLASTESVGYLYGLSNSFGISGTTGAGAYTTGVIGTLTNPNYVLSGSVNGTWTVNPKPIVVTALGGSSIYGSSPSNPGFTASGLVNGQTTSVLTGLSNSFGISASTDAGSYATNVVGALTNPNYAISSRVAGSWAVTPKSIAVTALGGSSTYGSSPANPGLSAAGLVNGQTASVLTGLSNSFGITNETNAGSYATSVVGTLTNGNYTVGSRAGGTWTVSPASVFVTALGGASTYGSSPANPGLSATGLVNGQDVSVLTGLSNSFGITNQTDAGSYATSVVGTLTNGNYAVANRAGGAWLVTPAPIVVTALGGASTYGSSPANPGLSATGLVNGQDVSVLTGLSNSFGITNQTNAGSYGTSVNGTLTNGNYTLANVIGGQWVVNPAAVVVTALGGSSVYGSNPIDPGLSATGLVNGQDASVLTGLSNSFGINAATNAGSYATNVAGTLSNGNYVVAGRADGSWVVTPAPVFVTALGGTSVYGSSPSNPGLGASGLVNGQDVTVLTGLANSFGITNSSDAGNYRTAVIGALTNPNYTVAGLSPGSWIVSPAPLLLTYSANGASSVYGSPIAALSGAVTASGLVNGQALADVARGTVAWSTNASSSSGVGNYQVSGGGLASNGNYALSSVQAPANATAYRITPAPLTVTYNANTQSSLYGNVPPAPSGSVSAVGLVNGDSLNTVTSGTAGWTTSATASSNVGSYAINGSGLAATSANYVVNFLQAGGNARALTITPRPLTVTADPQQRVYGAPNPVLSYAIAAAPNTGLVNGDRLSGALTTPASAFSPAGKYSILLGSLTASPNYALTYLGADLTVTMPPIQALNSFLPVPGTAPAWLQEPAVADDRLDCAGPELAFLLRSEGKMVLVTSRSGATCH